MQVIDSDGIQACVILTNLGVTVMSVLFAAFMMMAPAPEAAPSLPPVLPVQAKKQKPKQICQTVDVTGSRVPQRICHDANTGPAMDGDQSDATFGLSKANTLGTSNAYQPR